MARAVEITVSVRQRAILDSWTRNQAGTSYRLVERSRLILMSADGLSNTEQGRRLNVDRQRARRWRTRWAESEAQLATAEQEGASDRDLAQLLLSLLADHERPGTPATFTAKQLTQIIGVACEVPCESGRPVTHWTPSELADEKTGIQARERLHPTLRPRPGRTERIEFEYCRHGTLCLIANFEVATGKSILPTIGPTRTEQDFAAHIGRTIDADPDACWIFVLDQLNTHKSAALVQLVAERCSIGDDLGTKGKTGVLATMATRKAFLESPDHRIRFVYTPRHASWLNQVEIWFSILTRRVLKRASFASIESLKQRLTDFIDYFNAVLAKPFRWTYAGKPLHAA